MYETVLIIYLGYAEDIHLFFLFLLRIFLIVKIRVKYRLKYLITGILLIETKSSG
jgi:hypothetical protein